VLGLVPGSGAGVSRHSPANLSLDEAYVKIISTGILFLGLFLAFAVPKGRAQDQQKQPTAPPPALPKGIQQPPPPLPKVPDVRQPGETGWWIELDGWIPRGNPTFDKGHAATFTDAARSTLEGTPKYGENVEAGIALGLHNALRFSYFSTRSAGDFTAPNDLQIFNQTYTAGTLLSTNYVLQNGKISFEYLTWPYPVESRRFRLKTLWGVQYTGVRTSFDAPLLPLVDSNGNPLVDSSGNLISYAGTGSRWFISPELGLGVAYYSGRHIRFEANASGFTIPHHNTVWDTDASVNYKQGHFELRVGAKSFHFKTSTQSDYFTSGTMSGAFVGIRWHSE
jgi:hypothetical protein